MLYIYHNWFLHDQTCKLANLLSYKSPKHLNSTNKFISASEKSFRITGFFFFLCCTVFIVKKDRKGKRIRGQSQAAKVLARFKHGYMIPASASRMIKEI